VLESICESFRGELGAFVFPSSFLGVGSFAFGVAVVVFEPAAGFLDELDPISVRV
jgi:hypothetical protein